ncbi:MAG: HGGxSTG domain-containing protein [Gemmatimonadaceae bacterium]
MDIKSEGHLPRACGDGGARARTRGEPCRAPAVRGSARCRLHGGWSTGPTTEAGLERSRRARLRTDGTPRRPSLNAQQKPARRSSEPSPILRCVSYSTDCCDRGAECVHSVMWQRRARHRRREREGGAEAG